MYGPGLRIWAAKVPRVSSPPTQLVSGEGVAFELNHAGIGSRIVAALIDFAIQLLAGVLLVLLTGALIGNVDSAAATAVLLTEVVLLVAGYPIVMEWLARGRTLGKMAMGLRVVRDDGGPIGFRQALVRGLSGLVLEKPGMFAPFGTAAGVLTMVFSAREKRLGDMMAGTFVLNERAGPQRSLQAREFFVPPPLQPWAAALDLNRLDDQLALGVRNFVVRAHELTPAAQHALGEDLRARVEAVIAPPPPPGTPTPWVLMTVLAERRRRTELAAPRAVPPLPYGAPGYPPAAFGPAAFGPAVPPPGYALPGYAPPAYAPPGYAPPAYAPPAQGRPDEPPSAAPPSSPFAPPS